MGSLTATIDLKRYGRLLAKAVPRVIGTEEEHGRALAIVESLMEKGERNMTPEEDALLDLLTNLIGITRRRRIRRGRSPSRTKWRRSFWNNAV
jgi:hypothetical protein